MGETDEVTSAPPAAPRRAGHAGLTLALKAARGDREPPNTARGGTDRAPHADYPRRPRRDAPRLGPRRTHRSQRFVGDIVGFDCLDASNGQLTADSVTSDLETLVFDQVDQVNGPVEVTGAEPGDSLQNRHPRARPRELGLDRQHPRLRAAAR